MKRFSTYWQYRYNKKHRCSENHFVARLEFGKIKMQKDFLKQRKQR